MNNIRHPTLYEQFPIPPHLGGLPSMNKFLKMSEGGKSCNQEVAPIFGSGLCTRPKNHIGVCMGINTPIE